MKTKEKFELSGAVWKLSFSALFKKPAMVIPLAIVGLIKGIILTLLYYYPRPPLLKIAGPLLTYYHRVHYLHYPANFIFLTKLNNHLNLVLGIILVSFFSGWAVYLINNQIMKKPLELGQGFKAALARYFSLLMVWLIVMAIAIGLFKGEGILLRKYFAVHPVFLKFNFRQIVQMFIYINLLLASLINTIFAFAVPGIMLEKKGFFKSIIRSFRLMKTLFLPAFILVTVPSLLILPISLLKYNLPRLMLKFFPEVTMIILALSIVVVFIIDAVVLTSVTTLFVLNKETET